MNQYSTALRLPKIDGASPQKNQPYFNASQAMLPNVQNTSKGYMKSQKMLSTVDVDGEAAFGEVNKGIFSDKTNAYSATRERAFFGNPSRKQDWILKKLEAQREILENAGGGPYSPFENPRSEVLRKGTKPGANGQLLEAMNSKLKDIPPGFENESPPKAVNLSSLNFGRQGGRFPSNTSPKESPRKKPDVEVDPEAFLSPINEKDGITPKATLGKYSQGKFPALNPNGENKPEVEPDKSNRKVNIELILTLNEKLRTVYENPEDRESVVACLKDYLELIDIEDPVHIEALFFDTRARRNIKAYTMLEKTAAFTLILLLTDEAGINDSQETHIRNICHYMYSNFINFVDTVVAKLELLPRFGQIPNLDKLKQIPKKRPQEIDRVLNLEQVHKLLLKVLRTCLRQFPKKNDYSSKVDKILEKIEFGLMVNYNNELKSVFKDLISKHNISLKMDVTQSTFNSPATKEKFNKEKKPYVSPYSAHNAKASLVTSASGLPAILGKNDYYLPPPVPKPGQENKPIYTLVLDMDETLIHFEEVAGRGRFFVRPYAEKFLQDMSEIYEIVVFTAGAQDYADKVLNILDPNGYIDHRLYRHHITINPSIPGVLKDLSRLGRDLSKTIIIDNSPDNFRLQLDNGLEILTWYNDPYDTELLILLPFLTELVTNKVPDVRKNIKKFKEKRRNRNYCSCPNKKKKDDSVEKGK